MHITLIRTFLLCFLGISVACNQNSKQFNGTGLSEDEFYEFLNEKYSEENDTTGSIMLFAFAAKAIEIPYENGMPTIPEPPPTNFLDAPYKIDSSRIKSIQLVSKESYSKILDSVAQDNCGPFKSIVGKKLLLIYLPWFNPKDSSLLFCEVNATCPPSYHAGQGVYYRYKKVNGHWTLFE